MIPTKPYKFIVAAVGGLLSVVLAVLGLTDVLPANVAAILTVAAQVLTAAGVWLKANPPTEPVIIESTGTRVG
jgi:hypothetical protein